MLDLLDEAENMIEMLDASDCQHLWHVVKTADTEAENWLSKYWNDVEAEDAE